MVKSDLLRDESNINKAQKLWRLQLHHQIGAKTWRRTAAAKVILGVVFIAAQLISHHLLLCFFKHKLSVMDKKEQIEKSKKYEADYKKERVEKFKKYEAEFKQYLIDKYFSDKTIDGGNIYDAKVNIGGTIMASRAPPYQSYLDDEIFDVIRGTAYARKTTPDTGAGTSTSKGKGKDSTSKGKGKDKSK